MKNPITTMDFIKEEAYLWNIKYEKVIREELKYVDYFFSPSNIVTKKFGILWYR